MNNEKKMRRMRRIIGRRDAERLSGRHSQRDRASAVAAAAVAMADDAELAQPALCALARRLADAAQQDATGTSAGSVRRSRVDRRGAVPDDERRAAFRPGIALRLG